MLTAEEITRHHDPDPEENPRVPRLARAAGLL
jgi:hypothetical protein